MIKESLHEKRLFYFGSRWKICCMDGLCRISARMNIDRAIHNNAGGSRMTPEIKPAINK